MLLSIAALVRASDLAICLTSGVRDEAREAVRSDWTRRDGESSRPPLTAFPLSLDSIPRAHHALTLHELERALGNSDSMPSDMSLHATYRHLAR